MNTMLWTVQILVAIVMTLSGAVKVILSRERLAQRMHWAASWPRWRIKLLGLAELAGAVGLVVPMATNIAPVLTPIAALCLAVLMAGAARTHRQLGEAFEAPVVVGVLCVALAAGRLVFSVSA